MYSDSSFEPQVVFVDKDNKIQVRGIELGEFVGMNVNVTKGLNVGETIVTEGIQRVRPGQVVQPNEVKPAG